MRMLFFVLLMTLCGALGALFFKHAAERSCEWISLLSSPQLYLGGCFYLAGAGVNIVLLHRYAYSLIYPLTSLTYVWSLVLSAMLLRERITVQKMFGVAAVCIGVFLVTQ